MDALKKSIGSGARAGAAPAKGKAADEEAGGRGGSRARAEEDLRRRQGSARGGLDSALKPVAVALRAEWGLW